MRIKLKGFLYRWRGSEVCVSRRSKKNVIIIKREKKCVCRSMGSRSEEDGEEAIIDFAMMQRWSVR